MSSLPDSLYRLLRQQQFADLDARKAVQASLPLRPHANKMLSQEAAQAKRLPTLERIK